MKKIDYIIISSMCFLVLLTICIASNGEEYNDQLLSQGVNTPKDSLNLSGSEQDNSTWGYDEWRNYTVYKRTNMTESELDPAITSDPTFQHNLNIATIGIWGFTNGTFTEDELIELSNGIIHNTVTISVSSYVETSDERLSFYFNVNVHSNIILSYNVYSVSISYKSTDPSGKWYSSSYQQIDSIVAVLADINFLDTLPAIFTLSSNFFTGSLENDLSVRIRAICSQQIGIIGVPIPFWVDEFESVDLTDDDSSGPVITTEYHGDSTDGNPGYFRATASDPSGVIWQSGSRYDLSNYLGYHSATFRVRDNDNDRPYDSIISYKTATKYIIDDDITGPNVTINYYGSRTDGDPGYWEVVASDDENDIHEIKAWIDDESTTPIGGRYTVPNELGEHVLKVEVYDKDLDRGLIDREMTKSDNTVLIVDDDIIAPEIVDYLHNSVVYDNEELIEIRVMAVDELSGIFEILSCNGINYPATFIDGYYTFYIPNPLILGFHTAEIRVFDNDNDRTGDRLYDFIVISYSVIDDDSAPPIIVFSYSGDYTDGNPGWLTVSAFDDSGSSLIPYPYIALPGDIGTYEYTFTATDNDNDREGDSLSTTKTITITIVDDDNTQPFVDFMYCGAEHDEVPGYFEVLYEDLESGIDSLEVWVDGDLAEAIDGKYYFLNTLGQHTITALVYNADLDRGPIDQEFTEASSSVWLYDDDTTPPVIEFEYIGSGDDSNPGYWKVTAEDSSSGIDTMEVWLDGELVGTSNGDYLIQNVLGEHTISVLATNADFDRGPEDQESTSATDSIFITDDDFSSPDLSVHYIGSGLDCDAGYWSIFTQDLESGIDFMEIWIDGELVGTTNGDYYIDNNLGEHTIYVLVTNADLDRGIYDQESTTFEHSIIINDDDETPPQISNINIQNMVYYVHISFDAIDDNSGDDIGISMISIIIDGVVICTDEPLEAETHFEFMIFNSWAMDLGDHIVLIEVSDSDDDRETDSLSTSETGVFTTYFEDMKDFVIWEIDQLKVAIQESPDDQWGDPADQRKAAMLNKLNELTSLVNSLNYEEAYDKLLHDIKPFLTGLKVDENGIEFGNGTFKNSWVTGDDFVDFCDQILADLQILTNNY